MPEAIERRSNRRCITICSTSSRTTRTSRACARSASSFSIKSTKTVSDLLHSLERKGYIERDPSRSRGVRLARLPGRSGARSRFRTTARSHAGEPALLPEHREGLITMDRRFLPSDDVFFLKIKGDSMIGRGIFEGDFVMIQPGTDARTATSSPRGSARMRRSRRYTHRDGHGRARAGESRGPRHHGGAARRLRDARRGVRCVPAVPGSSISTRSSRWSSRVARRALRNLRGLWTAVAARRGGAG